MEFYVPTPNYQAPDWSWLAGLPDQFYQGNKQKQQYDLSHMFDKGVPLNNDGSANAGALLQMYGRNGDVQDVPQLSAMAQQQQQLAAAQREAANLPSFRGGGSAPPSMPAPDLSNLPPASAGLARSTATAPQDQNPSDIAAPVDGASVSQLMGQLLPGNSKNGAVATNIARAIGVSPNVPLTPEQQSKARGYITGYASRNGLELPGNGLLANEGIRSYLGRVAQVESAGNPNAQNGSASGEFQLEPATARQYGVTDPKDPSQAAPAVARLTADNQAALTKSLGRAPTEDELYLAHQQGAAGAARLLNNPDKLAINVVGRNAVLQNGGSSDMTAGQFAQLQERRFADAGGAQGRPIVPQVPLPQGFSDAQKASLALRAKAAQMALNPAENGLASFYSDWADRIDASRQPVWATPGQMALDPASGQVEFRAPQNTSGARSAVGLFVSRLLRDNPDATADDIARAVQNFNSEGTGLTRFTSGPQGNAVRSFNVLVDHLGTLNQAIGALKNGDVRLLNQIGQQYSYQTGNPAPTNFAATKALVGDELTKAIVGGGGALADRDEIKSALDQANSPEQLAGVINQYRKLALGQLRGLQQQYESATGRDDFDKLLSTGTESFFKGDDGQGPPSAQAGGQNLPKVASDADYDALASGAVFVGPDGKKRKKP